MLFELLCDLRTCCLPRLVKCGVAVALALCGYTALAFATATDGAVQQSFSRQTEYDIYGLTDSFMTDPDGFYDFRCSDDNLRALASFNDALSTSASFTFLSMFNQPVPVANFKGGPEFGYSYAVGQGSDEVQLDGSTAFNAKCVQINRAAFEFYDLRVAQGTAPAWSQVDYSQGRIPVLLGSKYAGVYAVGDTFTADLYGRVMTFEVVGLLEAGSVVSYQGDAAYGLDYSIVVPYPQRFAAMGQVGDGFNGIVLFAYVNGDVAVPKGTSAETLLDGLDRMGVATGFADFGVVGLYDYSTKMAQVRQLIAANVELVAGMVTLAMGIGCLIVAAADRSICQRRDKRRRVAELLGCGHEWRRDCTGIETVWWALSCVLTVAAVRVLPYQNSFALLATVAGLAIACLVDMGVCTVMERQAKQ